jgi:hypothetical protein
MRGRHKLKIIREGFRILEEDIVVSNSDNKFNFVLADIAPKPVTEKTIVKETLIREKPLSRWFMLGAAVVSAGLAVYAQAGYSESRDNYEQPGLPPYKYDNYAEDGETYLKIRAGSIISTLFFTSIFGFQSLK